MKKPAWRNRNAVKAWASELLDERLFAAVAAHQERPFPTESEYVALLLPAWIEQAVRNRDIDTLVKLTAEQGARRKAFERLLLQRPRGRPPGPTEESLWVQEAAQEVDFLVDAFVQHFERQRGTLALATEIVAERHKDRVTEDQILQRRHDQTRKDRKN